MFLTTAFAKKKKKRFQSDTVMFIIKATDNFFRFGDAVAILWVVWAQPIEDVADKPHSIVWLTLSVFGVSTRVTRVTRVTSRTASCPSTHAQTL